MDLKKYHGPRKRPVGRPGQYGTEDDSTVGVVARGRYIYRGKARAMGNKPRC